MKFLSCFGEKQKAALDGEEGLLEGQKPGCVFCGVTREKGFDIVEEVRCSTGEHGRGLTETQDDELIVFRDRWPRAAEHLLIIPRRHVISVVPELTARDIPMSEYGFVLRTQLPRPGPCVGPRNSHRSTPSIR